MIGHAALDAPLASGWWSRDAADRLTAVGAYDAGECDLEAVWL